MIVNCIVNITEIIKYYLIMKNILGFQSRKNIRFVWIGFVIAIIFSTYVTITNHNPILFFQVFVFVEIFMLMSGKIMSMALATLWMQVVVALLDEIFYTILFLCLHEYGIQEELLEVCATILTLLFIALLVCMVKKRTNGENIKLSFQYYVYLFLLTLAEGMMLYTMMLVDNEYYSGKQLFVYLICAIIMIMNIVFVLCLAVSNDGYKQRDILNRMYLKMQEEHYLYLKEKNEDTSSFRHDIKAHLLLIRELNVKKEYEKLDEYIGRIEKNIHLHDRAVSVNNGVVDAIINQKIYEAEKKGVCLRIKGELYEDCYIEPYDLCVIFDNSIKNAIEAAQLSRGKTVDMIVNRTNNRIHIYIENDCMNDRINENGEFVTTKNDKENHGYGLKNLKQSVYKYHGTISMLHDNEKFYMDIFL